MINYKDLTKEEVRDIKPFLTKLSKEMYGVASKKYDKWDSSKKVSSLTMRYLRSEKYIKFIGMTYKMHITEKGIEYLRGLG